MSRGAERHAIKSKLGSGREVCAVAVGDFVGQMGENGFLWLQLANDFQRAFYIEMVRVRGVAERVEDEDVEIPELFHG